MFEKSEKKCNKIKEAICMRWWRKMLRFFSFTRIFMNIYILNRQLEPETISAIANQSAYVFHCAVQWFIWSCSACYSCVVVVVVVVSSYFFHGFYLIYLTTFSMDFHGNQPKWYCHSKKLHLLPFFYLSASELRCALKWIISIDALFASHSIGMVWSVKLVWALEIKKKDLYLIKLLFIV